ncbi:MAG TPA: hypothetical protein VG937_30695 [Polyangiaceae bacterium]|nr:hypothetical protein [Polyangiaceae bacterium]
MSDDPLDQLSARLFRAAREEPLPDGAERRALEAMLHESGAPRVGRARSRILLLAAAFAGLVLLSTALSKRDRPEVSIAAEHPSVVKRAPTLLPATATPPPPEPAKKTEALPTVTSAKPKSVAPEHPTPPTLQDELEALRVAEKSLSAADPSAALQALDRYDRVLKGQKLRAEATLLRIEALSKSGQSQAAAELAARFAKQNPSSPLVDRARSFINQPAGEPERDQ